MTARPEAGSALVLALLVTFIISILGVSFLLMAQTETRIARNEGLAAQALYMADSGSRVVVDWFDRPGVALGFPTDPAVVDRSLRLIVDETDPYGGPPTAGAGLYKQDPVTSTDLDLDGDGVTDLFQRPYRAVLGIEHALMGTEDGPDMRIDDGDPTSPSYAFLNTLSERLFGPPEETRTLRWRLSRIDVYAPPYVPSGGNWARYGVGTIRVTARIYKLNDGSEQSILAEHTTTAVVNEIPYGTPVYGPLHTCGNLQFTGELSGHWGPVTAQGDILGYDPATPNIAFSLPRSAPPGPRLDRLWVSLPSEGDCLSEYANLVPPAEAVVDPWLRVVAKGVVDPFPEPAGTDPVQLYVPAPEYPRGTCDATATPPPTLTSCCDRSNLTHNHDLVLCPKYDYGFWKNLAMSGRHDTHYFVPDGAGFRENGVGPVTSFETATNLSANGPGIYFFDTTDRLEPRDDTGDGVFDNLSPAITIDGSTWQGAGFVHLNAESLTLNNLSAPPLGMTMRAPGEPFLDTDGNRQYDAGEAWINLSYPAALGTPFNVDPLEDSGDDGLPSGTGPVRNTLGPPPITAQATFFGILHTNGTFTASGNGIFFGSVIAAGDVVVGALGSAPDFYWDDRVAHRWPPDELNLPRVAVTRWIDEP